MEQKTGRFIFNTSFLTHTLSLSHTHSLSHTYTLSLTQTHSLSVSFIFLPMLFFVSNFSFAFNANWIVFNSKPEFWKFRFVRNLSKDLLFIFFSYENFGHCAHWPLDWQVTGSILASSLLPHFVWCQCKI